MCSIRAQVQAIETQSVTIGPQLLCAKAYGSKERQLPLTLSWKQGFSFSAQEG